MAVTISNLTPAHGKFVSPTDSWSQRSEFIQVSLLELPAILTPSTLLPKGFPAVFQTKSSTLALVGPAILNCTCGTFRVTGASAAPLVESPQSLCSRLHKLPHDKQEILPRACPSVRCSSPVPHGTWYMAANQLNYRRLHPAVENTKFHSWLRF